jgi:hypothetical protein
MQERKEMNDKDLDEILDHWVAPAPSPRLRQRVLAEFRALNHRPRRRWWISLAVLSGALLVLIGNAVPKTQAFIPAAWSVDSEFIRYAPDGSSITDMNATSYSLDGNEIVWSRSDPRNPLEGALFRAADVILPPLSRAMGSGIGGPVSERKHDRARGFVVGCGGGALTRCLQIEHYFFERNAHTCINGTVIGNAMILNHSAIGVQEQLSDSFRITLWLAPDLECFALKVDMEYRLRDGVFHIESEKRASRISGKAKLEK